MLLRLEMKHTLDLVSHQYGNLQVLLVIFAGVSFVSVHYILLRACSVSRASVHC